MHPRPAAGTTLRRYEPHNGVRYEHLAHNAPVLHMKSRYEPRYEVRYEAVMNCVMRFQLITRVITHSS
jgi:hypothetical protein